MREEDIFAMVGIGAVLFFVLVIFAVAIFFLLTLYKLMNKISPANQTMAPGLVWLNLVPILNLGWPIYTAIQISESLSREFAARNIPTQGKPGYGIGMSSSILNAASVILSLIPVINILVSLALIVLLIIYWVQMAGFSKQLDQR